jgi:NitT/TauT family transport system ATP-binding protein
MSKKPQPRQISTREFGPVASEVDLAAGSAEPSSKAEALRVSKLRIEYHRKRTAGKLVAVSDVSFSVRQGELVCLIGPSGCGKSSVLGALAGLVPFVGDAAVFNQKITKPGPDRAVVFQSASLLPWRTVERNITYGLELQHVAKREARDAAAKAMEMVGLAKFKDAYPNELSGGMQQRVNFARALVGDPAVLLMDEPFAALDAQTRERLQMEIADLWSRTNKAGVFITHQIDEAVFLADEIVVMGPGPGSRVIAHYKLSLSRPRSAATRQEPEFLRTVAELRQIFGLT